jgi:hypothetical protein
LEYHGLISSSDKRKRKASLNRGRAGREFTCSGENSARAKKNLLLKFSAARSVSGTEDKVGNC